MRAHKCVTRVVSILLIAVMVFQIVGCNQKEASDTESTVIEAMDIEEVANYSFDAIGGTDVMPIVGFYGPCVPAFSYNLNSLPDYLTDEFFQLIADLGVNSISHSSLDYVNTKEQVLRTLDLGAKYNIAVQVNDPRILEEGVTLEQVDAYINEYSNHPAYCGNYVVDEPGQKQYIDTSHNIDKFGEIYGILNELNVYGYTNLFPMTAGREDKYEAYLDEFVDTFHPPYILYDMYPFTSEEGMEKPRYIKNMTAIRQAAEGENIPFWTYIQVGSQYNDAKDKFDTDGYYPTKGQMSWNVGFSLAFGAKGIHYFPLIQPHWFAYSLTEPFDFQRNGLIGAMGNKTRWYYYAQELNKQIAAVDEVLMNSVNKGVIASGEAEKDLIENPFRIKGKSWRELANVTGDAMIGCFNYNGKTALYVLNYDMYYAQKIQLDLAGQYDIKIIQDAVEKEESLNGLELVLSAGNSALIVFE